MLNARTASDRLMEIGLVRRIPYPGWQTVPRVGKTVKGNSRVIVLKKMHASEQQKVEIGNFEGQYAVKKFVRYRLQSFIYEPETSTTTHSLNSS